VEGGADRATVLLGSLYGRAALEQSGAFGLHLRQVMGLGSDVTVWRAWRPRGSRDANLLVRHLWPALNL